MVPKDRFRLLAAVALADGRIDAAEREILLRSAAWLGLPLPVAAALVDEVRARGCPDLAPPDDMAERRRLYQGMLNIVLADGRIDAAEVDCLRSLGAPFGLAPAVVSEMIRATERGWRRARAARTTSGRVELSLGDPDAATRTGPVAAAESLHETVEFPPPTPSAAAPALEPLGPGALIAGRFLLGEQLGRGGFGTVFRARHADLDEDVALKVLHPKRGSSTAEQRFLREVKLARSFATATPSPSASSGATCSTAASTTPWTSSRA